MCPTDTTPDPRDMMRAPVQQEFPRPRLGPHGPPGETPETEEPAIADRPALPDHPQQMAVDVEDEDTDPVVDSGPGIADGMRSRS